MLLNFSINLDTNLKKNQSNNVKHSKFYKIKAWAKSLLESVRKNPLTNIPKLITNKTDTCLDSLIRTDKQN